MLSSLFVPPAKGGGMEITMKTKEELDALKEEVASVNEKLQELTPEELEQVNGGAKWAYTVGTTVGVKLKTAGQ